MRILPTMLAIMLISTLTGWGCKPAPPPDGVKKSYYWKGGPVRAERTYKGGKLNGPVKTYYKNGKPRSESHYLNGKLHGQAKKWNPVGDLLGVSTFKNGVKTGEKVYATGESVTLDGQF